MVGPDTLCVQQLLFLLLFTTLKQVALLYQLLFLQALVMMMLHYDVMLCFYLYLINCENLITTDSFLASLLLHLRADCIYQATTICVSVVAENINDGWRCLKAWTCNEFCG